MLSAARRTWGRRTVVGVAAGVVVLAAPVVGLGQQAQEPGQRQEGAGAKGPRTLVAIEFAGMGALARDEHDAGVARALAMVPARLKEMKRSPQMDAPMRELPDEAIDLVWNRLAGPFRMIVTAREGTDPNTGFPLIGVVLSFGMESKEEAETLHAHLNGMRVQSGMQVQVSPSRRFEGMLDAELPYGAVSYGPRQSGDGWRYEFLFGAIPHPDRAFEGMPGFAGGETVASLRVDLAAISPYVQPLVAIAAAASPQGGEMMARLRAQGVLGSDAMTIEATSSYVGEMMVKRVVLRGAGGHKEALGLPTRPLTADDLAAIPADAFFAHVYQGDLAERFERVRAQMGPMSAKVDGFLAQFREQTGVDLVEDVLKAFGSSGAVYMSHTTGGNSLMSLTAAQRVADRGRLNVAIERLAELGNAIAAQNLPGDLIGVSAARWEREGAQFTQLRVSGVPVPVQPTFALTEGWLLTSVTPQGCLSAVRQQAGGARATLMSNERFAKRFDQLTRVGEPVTLTFWDTRETLNDGYGLAQVACTALESFVRSPSGDRDPGMVMPTLGELREGVMPMLSMTYWDGEDYVMHQTSDRSILASLAGAMGFADLGPMIAGALAGSGITANLMERGGMRGQDWEGQWEEAPAEEPAF